MWVNEKLKSPTVVLLVFFFFFFVEHLAEGRFKVLISENTECQRTAVGL